MGYFKVLRKTTKMLRQDNGTLGGFLKSRPSKYERKGLTTRHGCSVASL
jgi:hypothetical protein